jgi:malonyl-CoA decarboxylase
MLKELRTVAQRFDQARRLRTLVGECQRLISERGSANSSSIATTLVQRFGKLDDAGRHDFFHVLARDFNPAPKAVLAAARNYAALPSAEHLLALSRTVESPRQELFRRINGAPGGTAAIVAMRRTLLAAMPANPQFAALESDLLHLLSSWFNPGFLQMQRVDWESPARLLELLIEHEAVHPIDGWQDLRRRLASDRRCFAFFHPQLPGEPLIFVEVALVREMPDQIAPLIAKEAATQSPEHFKIATFYSISNCQPGLRGVSLGNFLIKRVAEHLKREFPQLKTFCTLSPVPGFAKWLQKNDGPAVLGARLPAKAARLLEARDIAVRELPAMTDRARHLHAVASPAQDAMRRLCAAYLLYATEPGSGDAVARFHLDNGARLERINTLADSSPNGMKQSFGIMVNYLYDLQQIEENHEKYMRGRVSRSRTVAALI